MNSYGHQQITYLFETSTLKEKKTTRVDESDNWFNSNEKFILYKAL